MKRTTATIALFLAISMMIGLLAGCTTGKPASTTVDPTKPVVLRLATGNTDAIKVMNDIATSYAKTNPTVSLEITVIPGGVAGFNAAMASKFAASDAPDLFQYQWGTQITAYARAGHLMDLTGTGIKAALKEIKKPVNVFEGKDYAYPLVQGLWGLMYNSEIGKKGRCDRHS
jgi:ABC-type glycerol-3-phosphate transport system substrate-binding protein